LLSTSAVRIAAMWLTAAATMSALEAKWWVRAPRVTPASSTTRTVVVPP
jgi:hypothetical protein